MDYIYIIIYIKFLMDTIEERGDMMSRCLIYIPCM